MIPKEKYSLVICSPFYEIKAYSPYIISLLQSIRVLNELGITWDYFQINGDSYVDRAKNLLVNQCLSSGFTHFMMIDSDLSWDMEGFVRILKASMLGAEIVGGAFPNKNDWANYAVTPILVNGEPSYKEIGGLKPMEVWGMPGGFVIYSRKAFERTRSNLNTYIDPKNNERFVEYFKIHIQDNKYLPEDDNFERHIKDAFNRALADMGNYHGADINKKFLEVFRCSIEKSGGRMGEDIYFLQRYREMGGTVYLEPNITFKHYGVKDWEGNYYEHIHNQPIEHQNRKTITVANFNECIPDLSEHFNITNNMDKADAIVLWNDVWPEFREICEKAKKLNVPVFCAMHGIVSELSDYGPKSPYQVDAPVAEYHLVWCEDTKNKMMEMGIAPKNIFVVGCPLFKQRTNQPNGKIVYFPDHDMGTDATAIWNKIRSMNIEGITPYIKMLQHQNKREIEGNKIISDRTAPGHLDKVYEALNGASCLIVDDAGTAILLAADLDIPIIKIKNDYHNYFPNIIQEVSLEDLENTIKEVLANPTALSSKRKEFAAAYDCGNSIDNIKKAIEQVIN